MIARILLAVPFLFTLQANAHDVAVVDVQKVFDGYQKVKDARERLDKSKKIARNVDANIKVDVNMTTWYACDVCRISCFAVRHRTVARLVSMYVSSLSLPCPLFCPFMSSDCT